MFLKERSLLSIRLMVIWKIRYNQQEIDTVSMVRIGRF